MADPRPWVYGTEQPDVIATAGRDARFSGEGGDDVLYGGPAEHLVWPGGGSRPFPAPDLAQSARSAGVLAGAAGDDTLYGTGGRDYLYGGDGDDLLVGAQGDDHLSGGPGADTFLWRPLSPSNPVTDTAGDWVTDFQPGTDKLDLSAYQDPSSPGAVWKGTEPLASGGAQLQVGYAPDPAGGVVVRFAGPYAGQTVSGEFRVYTGYGGPQVLSRADFVMDWSAAPPAAPAFADVHQAQAARLYDTVLGREPDRGGLQFWHKALAGGHDLHAIADGFMASPEFQSIYAGTGNAGFVGKLYQHVLDRDGEPGGVAFWTRNLDAGLATRAEVVVGFSESAEHKAKVQAGDWALY